MATARGSLLFGAGLKEAALGKFVFALGIFMLCAPVVGIQPVDGQNVLGLIVTVAGSVLWIYEDGEREWPKKQDLERDAELRRKE